MIFGDIGDFIRGIAVLTSTHVTRFSSDGAPNATEVLGRVIDRTLLDKMSTDASRPALTPRMYRAAKLFVPWQADTSITTGVRVTARMLHASSTADGDFVAFGSTGAIRSFLATTTATSTSITGVAEYSYDLRAARRFIRFAITPNLVASSSGALAYGAVAVLGDADELPTGVSGLTTTSTAVIAALPGATTS